MRVAVLVLAGLLLATVPQAAAEDVVAGVSKDKIEITSNFTGTDIVVFGAVESEEGRALPADAARDVVVVVRSEKPYVVTVRKKERAGPIWVNRDVQRFAGVPGFYFLSSTRPLKDIARETLLEQYELGLDRLILGLAPGAVVGPKEFRQALVRRKQAQQLYSQHEGGVSFLSGSLFRTTVRLPPNIPAGNLKVQVFMFARGEVTSTTQWVFIDKSGVERQLSEFAVEEPGLYGLVAIVLSALAGFAAYLVFRERG